MYHLGREGRRFLYECGRRWIAGHFIVFTVVDAGQLRNDGRYQSTATTGQPTATTTEPTTTTTTENQTFTDVFQASSTAHAQVLLRHQSQSGCQGLETALTKDHPLQARSPGNETPSISLSFSPFVTTSDAVIRLANNWTTKWLQVKAHYTPRKGT